MFADAVVDQNGYFTEILTEWSSLAILHDYFLKNQPIRKSQHPSTSALLYLEMITVPIVFWLLSAQLYFGTERWR